MDPQAAEDGQVRNLRAGLANASSQSEGKQQVVKQKKAEQKAASCQMQLLSSAKEQWHAQPKA